MAYAIRFNSPSHLGMLVELPSRAIAKIVSVQDAADAAWEAYWDTPEEARGAKPPEPPAYPYFETVTADRAHRWVRDDNPHETLLFLEEGKIRRAA